MNKKNSTIWIITVLLSVLFVFFGNKFAARDLNILTNEGSAASTARVLEIEDTVYDSFSLDGETEQQNITTIFTCKILDGDFKDEVVRAVQTEDAFAPIAETPVKAGDKILILNYPSTDHGTEWVFGSYRRFDWIIILGIIFFALLVLFGRIKGINTMLSLAFTAAAIFMIYIPGILNGFNIYALTLIICAFITVMTLIVTLSWSKKTVATILGCLFGVLVAALLSITLSSILRLTGFVDEQSIHLTYLPTETPIDLKAIIFGGIVIGSLGAVMDVAMDISSSLFELHRHAEHLTFHELFKSGVSIGRDIIGTMANTLVLAYIGSALSTVLVVASYSLSLSELLNREMIIMELLQAIIGSTAILFTIPLTSIVCGIAYTREKRGAVENKETFEDF